MGSSLWFSCTGHTCKHVRVRVRRACASVSGVCVFVCLCVCECVSCQGLLPGYSRVKTAISNSKYFTTGKRTRVKLSENNSQSSVQKTRVSKHIVEQIEVLTVQPSQI